MADARAVGIDLGTSNSAVAWVDESGRTAMLRNSEGDAITPSVVMFDDSEVIVGKEARRLAPLDEIAVQHAFGHPRERELGHRTPRVPSRVPQLQLPGQHHIQSRARHDSQLPCL